jgi:hypothetical protein
MTINFFLSLFKSHPALQSAAGGSGGEGNEGEEEKVS